MKILFVNNNLNGLVHFRLDLMLYLQNHGHDIVAVLPFSEENQLGLNGIRVLYVPLRPSSTDIFYDISFFFSLLKVFKKEKPGYAFLYTIKPNIYGTIAAHWCGVSSSMMMAGLGYAFTSDCLSYRIARMLYRISLKKTKHLLLLNEKDEKTVLELGLCKPEKIILLKAGEGVNLLRFQFHDNTSDKVCFLFVGRLLREKGVLDFVDAARMVKKEFPDAEFQIAGSTDPDSPGHLTPNEMKDIESSGIVEFLGRIDMVKKMDEPGIILVLPSYYPEGMNRSLMEGCASGKPIITTMLPGCREAVDDGKNGYLVPPRQPDILAKSMLHYLKLPEEARKRMSEASRRIAEQRFDVRNVYRVYEDILMENNMKAEAGN